MRLIVATHYAEASVCAIARALERSDGLAALFTTWRAGPAVLRAAGGLLGGRVGGRIQAEVTRRSFPGISGSRIRSAARPSETAHLAARQIPSARPLATHLMYKVKERFDRAVARQLAGRKFSGVIVMYGSGQDTLATVRGRCLGVLNLVNSVPDVANRALVELGGVTANHREMVPTWVSRRVEREIELASVVLVPSQRVAMQLRRLGLEASRILVIPYGVDRVLFNPTAATKGRGSNLRCLYVGQISHGKGVHFLLEAARQFLGAPIEFLLVGPVVCREILESLPANVSWHPSLPRGLLAKEMASASMFVIPSVDDAYPLVTLEAMASGCPVIVSKCAGTSELVTDRQNGLLIDAGRADLIVNAIELLADDEQLRLRIGCAGRRRVEQTLSWEEYGDEVVRRLLPLATGAAD